MKQLPVAPEVKQASSCLNACLSCAHGHCSCKPQACTVSGSCFQHCDSREGCSSRRQDGRNGVIGSIVTASAASQTCLSG